ncbi:hypothetical protein HG530_005377 [Fusarium avenaceum]|nr:hypothetical protein HG530_005377 [Fusarium avenaceum]
MLKGTHVSMQFALLDRITLRSATKNFDGFLQISKIAGDLFATVFAKHIFSGDGLELFCIHVNNHVLRKDGKGPIRGVQKKVVDDLLANHVDESTTCIAVECLEDVVNISTRGLESFLFLKAAVNKLTSFLGYPLETALSFRNRIDRLLDFLAEAFRVGELEIGQSRIEGGIVRNAFPLEFDFQQKLHMFDRATVASLQVIKEK